MHFLKKHELIITILSVLVLVGAAASYYFYTQYRNTQNILKNPNLATEKQTKELITSLGKLMVLPKEQPTVATVTDASKLKDQPFFANAKNGDKVFIFVNAKKAVLYDPDLGKIVEVSPINVGNQPSPTPQQQVVAPTAQPTVAQQKPVVVSPTAVVVTPTPQL